MTTSDDHNPPSRPISVAELLAKNGSIGSPPVGGRRRRRRGDTDSISVAELTGEIPLITDDRADDKADDTGAVPKVNGSAHAPSAAPTVAREVQTQAPPTTAPPAPAPAPKRAPQQRPVEREPLPHAFAPQPQRRAAEPTRAPRAFDPRPASRTAPPAREIAPPQPGPDVDPDVDESDVYPVTYPDDDYDESDTGYTDGAEQMSFDPVVDEADPDLDDVVPADLGDIDDDEDDEPVDVSRYLRSGQDTLFGGESFADDVARGRPRDSDFFAKGPRDPELEAEEDHDDHSELQQESRGSSVLHGAIIVGQSILAVAFGAGMFLGFDQLWQWNPIVALVLSVLVILGLVVGVRVVRKTEDIASTLIAVAVGLLVCLGPLALLR